MLGMLWTCQWLVLSQKMVKQWHAGTSTSLNRQLRLRVFTFTYLMAILAFIFQKFFPHSSTSPSPAQDLHYINFLSFLHMVIRGEWVLFSSQSWDGAMHMCQILLVELVCPLMSNANYWTRYRLWILLLHFRNYYSKPCQVSVGLYKTNFKCAQAK